MSFRNLKWTNSKFAPAPAPAPAPEPVRKWINPKLLSAPAPVPAPVLDPIFYFDNKGEEPINRTWRNPNIVAAVVPPVEVGSKRPRYWDTGGSAVTTASATAPVTAPVTAPEPASSVEVVSKRPMYFASQPDFVPL